MEDSSLERRLSATVREFVRRSINENRAKERARKGEREKVVRPKACCDTRSALIPSAFIFRGRGSDEVSDEIGRGIPPMFSFTFHSVRAHFIGIKRAPTHARPGLVSHVPRYSVGYPR